MTAVEGDGQNGTKTPEPSAKFNATTRTTTASDIDSPHEPWTTVLETPCTFPPEIFHIVMLNLIKNPNITSSHLFRADIFYDSGETLSPSTHQNKYDLLPHLKSEYRPLPAEIPGYERIRTIVRQLIPRNPLLDKPLLQTCHLLHRQTEADMVEENMVLYIPHTRTADAMPFYHPAVSKLAFLHHFNHDTNKGTLSLSYLLFSSPDPPILTPKLSRTALRLLQTMHKHGQGHFKGYEKRVQLDRIIPQKRYQDTYTLLKGKYGRLLSEQWVEVTDPGKHVFEDIGIAAFLVELWREMYLLPGDSGTPGSEPEDTVNGSNEQDDSSTPSAFPGFVDIGCGNGILVFILLSEGYSGFGFDARQRKTWSIFPPDIQTHLQQRLLVPEILLSQQMTKLNPSGESTPHARTWHNGLFKQGTFIVSNHADELTPWTPLLAYLNKSSFIAIPCCSHDLSGARFRAPLATKSIRAADIATGTSTKERLPQQQQQADPTTTTNNNYSSDQSKLHPTASPSSGSLATTPAQKKMPSAYSSLCSYTASLAEAVDFQPEQEVLRIPSTRNLCIVGRYRSRSRSGDECRDGRTSDGEDREARVVQVRDLVEAEVGRSIEVVGRGWVERADGLARKPGSGH
ncbi:hypothetical protein LTR62_001832 [Meristemomyces frigidus]|uniref:tRNA (uracil-O(2)-)-methyltransferase n=1 Tax=Meristemomyces frigidus TaxID=1508187 RepID=A0AAN7TK40_9PEZI|nr:hypothetical protein LTR62_001832 [Meristemomyces frigidus]